MIKILRRKLEGCAKVKKHFGLKYGGLEFLNVVVFRHKGKAGKELINLQYDSIKKWLKKRYFEQAALTFTNEAMFDSNIREDCPIWLFWWQGIDEAPAIVKKCIESIESHKGKHEIVLLTKKNIEEYVDIPGYIYRKVNLGIISIPHFADILRTKLLYQHGGIWMDSTLFITDDFCEDIYRHDFYTIRHTQRADYHVCKGKWSSFFMASGKGNPLFSYLTQAQCDYWKNENASICYLLIDCFIALGYENILVCRQMIDLVPVNNTGTMNLASHFNDNYSNELVEELSADTYLHKLSNKVKIGNKHDNVYNTLFKV
jgi:hypothetical protein